MRKKFIFSMLFICLAGCSTFSVKPAKRMMTFDQDVVVSYNSGEAKEFKKDEQLEIKQESVVVSAKGHVSMIVFPVQNKEQMRLSLAKISKDKFSKDIIESTNVSINEVLSDILLIQDDLSKNKANQALVSTQLLISKNPELTILRFLEASCLIILNQKEKAKLSLKIGLKDFPNHRAAQSLFESLGGESEAGQ